MRPEDKLDSLLSEHLRYAPIAAQDVEGEHAGALRIADRLAPLRTAHPPISFTQALELRLLDHAASLAGQHIPQDAHATLAAQQSRRRPPRLLWQTLAAAVVLAFVGGGTLTVAASARPGSPLYGLHQLEQHVQVALTSTPAGRARLHLAYANDALQSLDAAATNHASDTLYHQTLETLRDEEGAARHELSAVPPGTDRDTLTVLLQQLHSRELHDLRHALPLISWSNRVETTAALNALGDAVPTITSVNIAHMSTDGQLAIRVTITGTGFQAGCVVYVDGAPAGSVLAVSATQVVADIPPTSLAHGSSDIGVQNPDGTAALVAEVGMPHTKGATSSPTTTVVKDGQHGPHSSGDTHTGGHGSDNGVTPTPTAMDNPHQ